MKKLIALMLASAALVQGCAHAPPDQPPDPLESINRPIFTFNMKADRYVMRPVARGYRDVMPTFARRGITNFFANLSYPTVIVNDLLQAKLLQGGEDLGRFVVNSTCGIGGLIDVASMIGLPPHEEDFGLTLGNWGIGPGWFLMLPLLGPSDNRDAVGRAADLFTSPTYYLPGRYDLPNYSVQALKLVNMRANMLGTMSLIESQFDPYIFVRTAYLAHRRSMVYGGNPPPESLTPLPPSNSGGKGGQQANHGSGSNGP